MSLKLYSDRFWISPWVFTCYITLTEKGVAFEVVELALDKKETRQPEYRQHTTTAKVPALEVDGVWLAESAAIIEYAEETWAPPLHPRALPADALSRARARQLMGFLRTDLFALREERPTSNMFYGPTDQPLSARAGRRRQAGGSGQRLCRRRRDLAFRRLVRGRQRAGVLPAAVGPQRL